MYLLTFRQSHSFKMDSKKRRVPRRNPKFFEMKHVILKFLVIGDYGVGKSAIVRRYTQGKFTSNYKTTTEVDFGTKIIQREPRTRVSIQLWDIAGNEKYKFMSRVSYKYAAGCMIVYDVTRPYTFYSAKKWLQDLRGKVFLDNGSNIPVVLLANKWDTEQHTFPTRMEILKFCKRNNILNWFLTSAKNNTNIDEAISLLVDAALNNTNPIEKPIPDLSQTRPIRRRNPKFHEIKDVMLKFLVIGDFGVGKTAIVRRFIKGKFTSKYKRTIGVDFASQTILLEPSTKISIDFWDIAGNEWYKFMSRISYKYAVGCIIVYDVTRPFTFYTATKWLQDLRDKVFLDDGSSIPVVLLANKWDLEQHSIPSLANIRKFCKRNDILDWFPTSAKKNFNIDEAILLLVDAALQFTKPIEKPTPDLIINESVEKRKEEQLCLIL